MTSKRPRQKPIVELRALDYRWTELTQAYVPHGALQPEAKAAWRLQYRREGETEWTSLPIVTINSQPPEES